MKRFLTTTAIAATILGGAPALASSDLTQLFLTEMTGENMQASELIGMRVYAAETGVEGEEIMGLQDGWQDVGEINDIILTRDGNVEAVIVDLGGFLGIGERQVAMRMDALKLVSDSETQEPGDFFIVVTADPALLGDAPELDLAAMGAGIEKTEAEIEAAAEEAANEAHATAENLEAKAKDAAADVAHAAGTAAEAVGQTAESVAAEASEQTSELVNTVSREGYEMAKIDSLTTEDLIGARVYDANGEWIGEIGQLNVNDNGRIEHAVIDVGGFLGLGEKPVALEMAKLNILRAEGMGDFRVEVSHSKAELEEMPTYTE